MEATVTAMTLYSHSRSEAGSGGRQLFGAAPTQSMAPSGDPAERKLGVARAPVGSAWLVRARQIRAEIQLDLSVGISTGSGDIVRPGHGGRRTRSRPITSA